MLDRARFEIMPFARGEEEAAALPEHVRLTVTSSPKHGLDRTVQVARRLRALGHAVTVHLAARMVPDRKYLDGFLEALAQAGIDDTFVIAGDASHSHGPYSSALDLVPIVHEHSRRPRRIGIASYPEGHPLVDSSRLVEALELKSRFADYITTQMCFDPKAVLDWVRAMRKTGVALPVLVGLPGVVDHRKLLDIAVRVGVGSSLAFLRKQGGLRKLLRLSAGTANGLHEALSPFVGDPRLGIAGFHYFTFNRLLATWSWERERPYSRQSIYKTQREVQSRNDS
jgi:methylenetetrahydrofolate reductase (NADPH)